MDLNSARFSSSTKTRLYISYNTKADTVYKILCSACLCLLLLVFPLVFAIGGASTKYEKDSATLYRPTIEYGLKVGQPASAKNILIDKTKNALARRRFLLLVFGVSRRYARRQSLYCNRNFARYYRPLYRRFRRQV